MAEEHKMRESLKLDDILIDGKSIDICKKHKDECFITFDSGTTYASFPRGIYSEFHGKIPYYNDPLSCKNVTDFGDITFVIENDKFVLKNSDWIDLNRSKLYPTKSNKLNEQKGTKVQKSNQNDK